MFFSVLLCSLVTTQIPFCSAHLSQETRYECGPHGKFEYCIDGIPGCVIGCHCHPGYYFDTDSKICEPNIKLTQDLRRHYFDEPTRAHGPPAYTPTVTDSIPTPTTIDIFDDKVDEIAKDTDDLGDWLYNQFFKTIENQVINNSNSTKNDNEIKDNPPTRRSGGGNEPIINKSRRKTRKSMRIGKKKKHMKVHGLRRKLLRITEDDSLFDSESDSDSSSSSSGSDSDSSSDTSGTSDTSDGKKSPEDKEHDHGHKKVIIFNRRPKPPLPSFIFLPSMDTPYYPPIGLPAPPGMPMYPMVPVPPMAPQMAPPMFPFPGPPKCDGEESTTISTGSATTTSGSAADTTSAANDSPPPEDITEPTEANPEQTELPAGDRRSRLEKHRNRRPVPEKFIARASEPGKLTKLKHGQRNKLMEKLRNKMKEKKRTKIPPVNDHPENGFKDGESLVMDEVPNSSEMYIPVEKLRQKNTVQQIPKLEDVDFRYLSELIHRVNQSEGNKMAPLPFDLSEDLKALQKIKSQQTRRNFNPYTMDPGNFPLDNYQHRNLQKQSSDDAYYTNLGRQIASMIRNSDSKLEHQINKDAGQVNRQVPFHSVLNENNYPQRSFWERSIRSPLSQLGAFTNYLDESRTLKHNNEKKLLHLENEVEIFASTPRPLSLQDLENILNTMQRAHAHIKYKGPLKTTKESNVNLNINLLPKFVKSDTNRRLLNAPSDVDYVNEHYHQSPLPPKVYRQIQAVNATNTSIFHEQNRNANVPFSDYWMYNHNPRQVIVTQTNISSVRNNQINNPSPTQQPTFVAVVRSTNNKPKQKEYLKFLRSMPVVKHTTAKRPEPKLLSSPPVLNYKSLNYFTGNKHHYMFEEATYPLHITPFKRHIRKPFGRAMNPSYFHHALHHFDYFD